MLLVNLHRTLSLRIVFLCSALSLCVSSTSSRAEGPAGSSADRSPQPRDTKSEAARGRRVPDADSVRAWDAASSPQQTIVQTDYKLVGGEASPKALKGDGGQNQAVDPAIKGTSSAAARKSAIATLPLDQLTPENRTRVEDVVKSVSFFRRLPTVSIDVDPQVYMYFVAHPDVAVSIWRAMKISKLQMWQTGRNDYEADAGDGTLGTLEVLHRSADKNLILCDGLFKSPLLSKPIKARSLLLLQTSFFREASGAVYATHRADMFVSFPSQTVEAVAKVLSPLTVSLTDRTFTEISLFLKMMSMAMARRPDWVEQTVNKMDSVPDLRRQQVLLLTAHVYTTAQKQALAEIETPAAGDEKKTGAPGAQAQSSSASEKPNNSAPGGAGQPTPVPPVGAAERDTIKR